MKELCNEIFKMNWLIWNFCLVLLQDGRCLRDDETRSSFVQDKQKQMSVRLQENARQVYLRLHDNNLFGYTWSILHLSFL